MKKSTLLRICFLWMLAVTPASASVVINEVAWMGGTASSGGASDEWIELYNPDASTVDLSGWSINADDGSPMIQLSGTIIGGGYFLIERTDDSTVPDVTADLVLAFGNGLSNAGETLRLKNGDGTDIDVVIGGGDWGNIGGNNATKETAQKTTNSWVTGIATPRAANIAQGGEVLGSTSGDAHTTQTTTGVEAAVNPTSKSTYPAGLYPRRNIAVAAGDDRRVFTGFPVSFMGSSSGLYDESLERATYRWNFGDGTIAGERAEDHVYAFAGEYVVTLEVFWANYHASDRLAVTVSDPDVIIAQVVNGEGGYVELANLIEREIDLSGWVMRGSSGASFVFPPNSILLAKKKFILPNHTSGVAYLETPLVLRYPNGGVASEWTPASLHALPPAPVHVSAPSATVHGSAPRPVAKAMPEQNSSERAQLAAVGSVKTGSTYAGATSTAAAVLWQKNAHQFGVGSLGHDVNGGLKWLFALLSIVLIVSAGFIISRSHFTEANIADEYAIIEDIIEGKDDVDEKRII